MMSGRARRVLVYTAALLLAPLPIMPTERGTPAFAAALMVWGAVLGLASLYVVQGERKLRHRGLLGNKLLASALLTLVFSVAVFVGAGVYLLRT